MCVFDRHDIKEWELSPLRDLSDSSQEEVRLDLLQERRWLTLLPSVWKASRARASVPRLDCVLRAGNTALGIGLEIPTPNPTANGRGQLTHRKTPTSPQHTHGILWSPQVAYARKCKAFSMLIGLVATCPICILNTYPVPFLSHRSSGRCGLSLQPAASLTSSSPRRKTSQFAVSCLIHPKTQPADTRALFFLRPFSRGFPQ